MLCHGLWKYLNTELAVHRKQSMPGQIPFKDATFETVMATVHAWAPGKQEEHPPSSSLI